MMQRQATGHAKYALHTGRVLDRPAAILELRSIRTPNDVLADDTGEIAELEPEDLVEQDEVVVTPAPPVIAKIVRTTHVEPSPPPASRSEAARARRPSWASVIVTVVVLAGIGALAGFGMRALARPPVVEASNMLAAFPASSPGDRTQRTHAAMRVSSSADAPSPPPLAAPPKPASTLAAVAASAKRPGASTAAHAPTRAPVRPAATTAVHAARAPHRPAAAAPPTRATKKPAKH